MEPITIALGLAQYVPQLIKWLSGSDTAAAVAEKAIDIAKQVTGTSTGDEALKALQADPSLVLQYKKAMLDQQIQFETLCVQNAKDINNTMIAEAAADHWPTYSWRPAVGFSFALNLIMASLLVIGTFIAQIFGAPGADKAVAALPSVLASLAAINALATPVLGVASWFRGKMQADPTISTDNRG